MPITTIFFDLDDTLYPASSGVWKLIKERMSQFMHEQLDIPWDKIPSIREKYFQEYGTTLRGLQTHYQVDVNAYLEFVHDVPLENLLKPDENLKKLINSLPQKKYIFTNADSGHAKRVLNALDLSECFYGIVDISAVDPYCKPMEAAFNIALGIAGEPEVANCVLIDDLAATTKAGKDFGFFTILLGSKSDDKVADAYLDDLHRLPDILKKINY